MSADLIQDMNEFANYGKKELLDRVNLATANYKAKGKATEQETKELYELLLAQTRNVQQALRRQRAAEEALAIIYAKHYPDSEVSKTLAKVSKENEDLAEAQAQLIAKKVFGKNSKFENLTEESKNRANKKEFKTKARHIAACRGRGALFRNRGRIQGQNATVKKLTDEKFNDIPAVVDKSNDCIDEKQEDSNKLAFLEAVAIFGEDQLRDLYKKVNLGENWADIDDGSIKNIIDAFYKHFNETYKGFANSSIKMRSYAYLNNF